MDSQKPGCLAFIFGKRPRKLRQTKSTFEPVQIAPMVETEVTVSSPKDIKEFPRYASRGILLTNTEVPFFHVLRKMAKDHLVIFPHVALRDLVSVVVDQSEYFAYYNKIDRKQVDFVLCEPETLKPVFAIELDDASHKRIDRQERDSFVETVLEEAKIPLVRIPVRSNYDLDELGKLFKQAVEQYVVHKNEKPTNRYTIENPPLCPRHGVRMVLRTTRRSGERFWGCPIYPQCREIIKLAVN